MSGGYTYLFVVIIEFRDSLFTMLQSSKSENVLVR
jgi:hypothetical protein